jgi:hypothetical protein
MAWCSAAMAWSIAGNTYFAPSDPAHGSGDADRGPIASGMTARTTAHLASALDDRYFDFMALRGQNDANLHNQNLATSIDHIEQIVQTEGTNCDFGHCDGYHFLAEGDDPKNLDKKIEACHTIGICGRRVVGSNTDRTLQHRASSALP